MLRKFLDRIDWPLVIAFPLAAATVHLITTFMAMADTGSSAYSRLSAALPANKMTVLAAVTPEAQPLPFTSSDARYAVCPFDTSGGAVDVNVLLPDLGWTIGVYKTDGTSVYFAASEPGRRTSVALHIVPADDRFLGLTPQAAGKPAVIDPQLSVAAKAGVIVVRAPDHGASYRADTDSYLAKAICRRVAS